MRIGSEQQPANPSALVERRGVITSEEQLRADSKDTEGQRNDAFAPVDSVELSEQGLAKGREDDSLDQNLGQDQDSKQQLSEMRTRDREVRAHEQAHKAAAGDLAVGGPSFEFETGPDGRKYAVAGEVQIQLKDGRTPEETLANMRQAQAAANAPASPSSADRGVAAAAAQKATEATREIAAERRLENSSADTKTEAADEPPKSIDIYV